MPGHSAVVVIRYYQVLTGTTMVNGNHRPLGYGLREVTAMAWTMTDLYALSAKGDDGTEINGHNGDHTS